MKGSYIIIIFLQKNIDLIIGALGNIEFKNGFYVYIGSAMGNSGSTTLINRVRRHVSPSESKKIHWHIDYLLDNKYTSIFSIYLIPSLQNLECLIANEFLNIDITKILAPKISSNKLGFFLSPNNFFSDILF